MAIKSFWQPVAPWPAVEKPKSPGRRTRILGRKVDRKKVALRRILLVQMRVEGLEMKVIAERLDTSVHTLNNDIKRVLKDLCIKGGDKEALRKVAIEKGWIE